MKNFFLFSHITLLFITIPETIRKIAHIHPGDLIEFEPRKDDIILRRLLVTRAEEERFMSDEEWDKTGKKREILVITDNKSRNDRVRI